MESEELDIVYEKQTPGQGSVFMPVWNSLLAYTYEPHSAMSQNFLGSIFKSIVRGVGRVVGWGIGGARKVTKIITQPITRIIIPGLEQLASLIKEIKRLIKIVTDPLGQIRDAIPEILRPTWMRNIRDILIKGGVPPAIADRLADLTAENKMPPTEALATAEIFYIPRTISMMGDIRDVLASVWRDIRAFMAWLADTVIKSITRVFDWVRDWYDTFQKSVSYIVKAIRAGLSWVNRAIWQSIQWLSDRLQDAWRWFLDKSRGIWQWAISNVMQGIHWLEKTIGAGARYIWSALATLSQGIFQSTHMIKYILDGSFQSLINTLRDYLYKQIPINLEQQEKAWQHAFRNLGQSLTLAWDTVWQDQQLVGNRSIDGIPGALPRALVGKAAQITDWFQERTHSAWNSIERMIKNQAPMTPEKAPALAGATLGAAIGFGVSAHVISLAAEAIHPLKMMGVHYLSAFLARMGQFSWIAGATMGVYIALGIRKPFEYYVNDLMRPRLPDDFLLQIMAVKPDIDIPTFRKGMAYQGYSERWIDAIQRTMFREPRYFELSMMAEDEAATDKWLFLKARRAGYTEDDSQIFTTSIVKKAMRSQRMDYYRQLFLLYKESYIDDSQFDSLLKALDLRPAAHELSKRAAELAATYDYISDMARLYTDEYLKDIISTFELELALVSLGIAPDKVYLLVRRAQIRKTPKPRRRVPKVLEDETAKLQTKYATLYKTQYRKDLITRDQYLNYLMQLGISPELAEVTVAIEQARKATVPTG